ncbi:LysR family transcriptional regulator [Tropicimonas marinistellae]|uniref:LysR family transcriptional regulator n=1 Tax=Tropicimonas marinistellae TaxID=1739787 RepID=UPI00082FE8ED|nr:LysR family transcriptional regulator [Tropicimonas marinistellae]
MRINFDFGDLEAFLAVLESGSFHTASRDLGLSQSAVTRRIQKLETALDSELFKRTTRAVKPTLAAKRLKTRAEAILEDARETTLAMRDESVALAHQRNAVVTIATIPTVVSRLMPDAIRLFRRSGNSARIRFLDMTAHEVAEAVSQGDADFGICSVPVEERNTEFEPLFDDPMVLALPATHALTGAQDIGWHDLANEALVLPARGTGNRLLIDDAMARARRGHFWTFEVHRTTTALDLVAGGCGIAILPRSAMTTGYKGIIALRQMPAPAIIRPIGILSRVEQAKRRQVEALRQAVRMAVGGSPEQRAT